MASYKYHVDFLLRWEGGYVDDPKDKGGATNMGVTLATWKKIGYDIDGDGIITKNDIRKLTRCDFEYVVRHYWNRINGNKIQNQNVANIIFDWFWHSGNVAIKKVQQILGVRADGIIGKITLRAINDYRDQQGLFYKIRDRRLLFIDRIIKNNPSQKKFERGWKRRIRALTYNTDI